MYSPIRPRLARAPLFAANQHRSFFLGAVALTATFLAHPARADDAVPIEDRFDEVIVTAERRTTTLQNTPIAITVVGGGDLRDRRLQVLRDLSGEVPSLFTPGMHQNMQSIFIRGIGTSDPGTYQSVGIYVDDVFIPRQFGNGLFDLPDIERVEVLRGPQGTLYGQNTSAGAIRFISREPGNNFVGSFDFGVGSLAAIEAHGYLAGPLVQDKVSASVAYTHRERDGYTYNATLGKDVDALATDQARIKLRFTPTDRLDITLSVDATRERSDNADYVSLSYPGSNPRRTYNNRDQSLVRDSGGASLRVSYKLDDQLTLRSITSVRGFHDDPSPWDQDGTPAEINGWNQYIEERAYSQEFQLLGHTERFDFTLGASYFRERLDFDRVTVQNAKYTEIDSRLRDHNAGLYGQGTYKVTDELSLTAGLRYNYDSQRFSNASYNTTAAEVRTGQIYQIQGLHKNWNSLTPKLSLDYRWSPDLMTYVSWTQGQKAGGYNRGASTALIAGVPVQPEDVTAYEVGAKVRAFDGRLQASLALFYNDFQNYQSSVTNPRVDGVPITGNVVVNAASAHTYGAEFEAAARPFRGAEVKLSVAYLQTAFDSFANPTGAANTNYAGHLLPSAPKWSISPQATYTLPSLGLPGTLQLRGRLRYVTSTYSDVANTAITKLSATTTTDLGASYVPDVERWSLSLSVTNVFDRTFRVTGNYNPTVGYWTAGYNQPRLAIVSLRYDL
jgi:iron complex outermembrane receptor protein